MLDIIYQDESIVVCVKPFRVLSTDEPGGMPDRIREAIGQPQAKVRTVHRLDQVVGGLMVYGLTGPAASELSRQIREDTFLKEYQASAEFVNAQPEAASALIEKFGIVKAAIAQKALPYCNITFVSGKDMQPLLEGYLKVLFEQNPKAIGGALPTAAFYYE
mgnify:CR=1 FL=1